MMKSILTCVIFLFSFFAQAQRTAIAVGPTVISNDIINSLSIGGGLHLEQQFSRNWSFTISLDRTEDSITTVTSVPIAGTDRILIAKYRNYSWAFQTGFRYYFKEALDGLFISPGAGVYNFNIVNPHDENGTPSFSKKKKSALMLGISSGINLNISSSIFLQISGYAGQGFIRQSEYKNGFIATGSIRLGYAFGKKIPKPSYY
jgi:hypothetical protein